MKVPALFLTLLVMMITGCQKETEPPGEKTEKEEITEADIGLNGGILKTDSIYVSIPAGAFTGTEALNLSVISDAGIFNEYSRSVRYRITGLPETFDQPMKISIAYSGSLTGETYVVVGEAAMDPETGEEVVFYSFLDAVDSAGYLNCNLPGYDEEADTTGQLKSLSSAVTKKWISIEVISNYFTNFYTWQDVFYKIYIPDDKKQLFSPMIIDFLDNAYDRINHSILDNPDIGYVDIFHVFLANLPGVDYCKFAWRNGSSDHRKKPKGILAVNVNKMDDDKMMRIMTGREVLRSLLFVFDHEYPNMRQPEQIPHHWLDQAVLSWSEAEFAEEAERADHIPSDFQGHELAPFFGLHAGIMTGDGDMIQNILNHGRGMSAFIHFLTDEIGKALIPGIYSKISEGLPPVDAIQSLFESVNIFGEYFSYKDLWVDFLSDYLQGNIYKIRGNTFIDRIPPENLFSIVDKSDTLKVFQGSFADLSVRLYKVDLVDQEFMESGTLSFSITGGNSTQSKLLLYGITNDRIALLGDELSFESEIFQTYHSFIVLVFNGVANPPYTGNSTIEFKVIARRSKDLPYKRCTLEIFCKGIYEHDKIPSTNPEPFTDTLNWMNTWRTLGETTGNVYTGTFDPNYHTENTSGSFRVTFDNALNIISFELNSLYLVPAVDSVVWTVEGSGLSKSFETGFSLQHELDGAGVCSAVTKAYLYSETPSAIPDKRQYSKMTSHLCDSDSHILFTFSNY